MTKHKTITQVRRKLELSHLESQRELLKDDVDLSDLSFITRNLPPMRFDDLVTDGEITRTIEGASTVSITLDDSEGIIKNSGRLAAPVDIKLDGLWFRLVKVQKSQGTMTLTFESREIAILRTYNKKKVSTWGKTRRSQFIRSMVEEVKEFKIPFICPDLIRIKHASELDAELRASMRQPGINTDDAPGKRVSSTGGSTADSTVYTFPELDFLPGNWPGVKAKGNINLNARPMVQNADGSVSTVRSITFTVDNLYILIPTVVGNAVVSDAAAIAHFNSTNFFLGMFDSEANADKYAEALHVQQAEYVRRKTHNKTVATQKKEGVVNSFPPMYVIPGTWTGFLAMGDLDLNARPLVKSATGAIRAIRPVIFNSAAGKYVVIPTVVGNEILDQAHAETHYGESRKHLGIFDSVDHALAYVKALNVFETEYIKRKSKVKKEGTKKVTLASSAYDIKIKGVPATKEQLDNCQQVIDVGRSLDANRKVILSAIMTIIQESTARNLAGGDRDSQGLFQQRPSQGWRGLTNITLAATEYYTSAMKYDKAHPDAALWEICQGVQHSGHPRAYAQWGNEANKIVTTYGILEQGGKLEGAANLMTLQDTGTDGSQFQFTRGHPTKNAGGKSIWEKEDSWTCMQRLANEVNWRVFEVSGTIYYTTDKHLFKSAPRAKLSEDSDGVNWIDFDYDVGKPTSQVTVDCYIDRWSAPPGSVVELMDMGPVNGRWLVNDITRPIFSSLATITLKKPGARLPEPKRTDATSLLTAFNTQDESSQYVATPGYTPNPPGTSPAGRALREAVLNNPAITFERRSEQTDISTGKINEIVLKFLLNFAEAGFKAHIYALKSDHHPGTNHNPSDGSLGRAVDLSNFTDKTHASTFSAMTWINANAFELSEGFKQYKLELIGPIPSLVYPPGVYDSKTLEGHKDHIHVGFDRL